MCTFSRYILQIIVLYIILNMHPTFRPREKISSFWDTVFEAVMNIYNIFSFFDRSDLISLVPINARLQIRLPRMVSLMNVHSPVIGSLSFARTRPLVNENDEKAISSASECGSERASGISRNSDTKRKADANA
jgi:hypothetical protein